MSGFNNPYVIIIAIVAMSALLLRLTKVIDLVFNSKAIVSLAVIKRGMRPREYERPSEEEPDEETTAEPITPTPWQLYTHDRMIGHLFDAYVDQPDLCAQLDVLVDVDITDVLADPVGFYNAMCDMLPPAACSAATVADELYWQKSIRRAMAECDGLVLSMIWGSPTEPTEPPAEVEPTASPAAAAAPTPPTIA